MKLGLLSFKKYDLRLDIPMRDMLAMNDLQKLRQFMNHTHNFYRLVATLLNSRLNVVQHLNFHEIGDNENVTVIEKQITHTNHVRMEIQTVQNIHLSL